ncbi:MAG: tetratricopeptide repeat protein [Spirochaetaceae bacterium]|jgi:outer membrane protein assembly factor BamD (BamD/ComL family)|nr:tetratricopeptide repeat protein [Spirochaetaceae bacterium]
MKNRKVVYAIAVFIAACYSGPVSIPNDVSAAEITQMAQSAMDRDRYNQAIQYYEAIIERFPFDNDMFCGAEYGIALIHYKQRKYSAAKDEFKALLLKYDSPGGDILPKRYQILSNIVLARISEKQKLLADN